MVKHTLGKVRLVSFSSLAVKNVNVIVFPNDLWNQSLLLKQMFAKPLKFLILILTFSVDKKSNVGWAKSFFCPPFI